MARADGLRSGRLVQLRDRLDNGGIPSAERIHPEWQTLSVGDRLASTPGGRAWFEVAALEWERFLGLPASLDWRGCPF